MKPTIKKFLFWSPRVLCVIFALFVSIFAFDVFEEHNSFWETALALVIHLIPTAVLLFILAISWKREWIGGIVFLGLTALYIWGLWGRFPLQVYLIMCIPMIVISILFFINWKYRAELRAR